MLMVDERPGLTGQAQDLLDIIRAADGWVSRSDIAQELSKTRLNVWDVKLLERLEALTLIEVAKRPMPGSIGYRWEYRAK